MVEMKHWLSSEKSLGRWHHGCMKGEDPHFKVWRLDWAVRVWNSAGVSPSPVRTGLDAASGRDGAGRPRRTGVTDDQHGGL